MDTPILYHSDMSVCAAKVRSALAEKGVEYTSELLNLRAGDGQKPEYTRLNPNQVVPTLVHGGVPIIESNVILEYIDDMWPTPGLRPTSPLDRSRMRLWNRQLDDGLHAATGTLSTCIAFRHQHLSRQPEEFKAWLEGVNDPVRRERLRLAIELGMDSPGFAPAVKRFEKLLSDMDAALASHQWLAGDGYSLADIAYSPYMIRLKHLGFGARIDARPRVADWAERLFARQGFKIGVEQWFNVTYMELFDRQRPAARECIERILSG